jgi:hypothetical protein
VIHFVAANLIHSGERVSEREYEEDESRLLERQHTVCSKRNQFN